MPSRALVANQLNTDLGTISDWCSMCGMLLNPNKSLSLIVSRARNSLLPHSPLILNGSVIQESESVGLVVVMRWVSSVSLLFIPSRFSGRIFKSLGLGGL